MTMKPECHRSMPFNVILKSLLFIATALLPVWHSAHAKPNLSENQQLFLDAYQAIKSNDRQSIANYKAKLKDYPLYPYVLYHDYRLHLKSTPNALITQFIDDNSNNYLGERLQSKWLEYLGEQKQWKTFLTHYQPQASRDLQCYHVQALANQNQMEPALQQAAELWISERPLSEACQPLDGLLRQHNRLTGSMIWQRIELAMSKRRVSLAQTLAKNLSSGERAMFQHWLKVYQSPDKILTPLPASIDPVIRKPIFMQAVKRLSSKEPEKALQALEKFYEQYGLSKAQFQQLQRAIALRSAYKDNPNADEFLQEVNENGSATEESLRWQAQLALKQSNWRLLLETIELMDHEQQQESQWQYWKARALAATSQEKPAQTIYRELAKQRHFYAFMAADILKTDYQFNPDPVMQIDSAALIKKYPQLRRMQELLAIDWLTSAKREWYSLLDRLGAEELHAVSILTSQWQQHSMAITTAAKAQKWDDLAIRFPTPHKEPVMQSAEKHGVDPAWVYGVIRRESAFAADVRSSAGAIGLMQLMPQTARYIGQKLGFKKNRYTELTEPNSNIELGSAYLSYLYKKYDGNRVLATAAYNAGPQRVDSWIPKDGALPADQWIDSIPFSETRAYVKAVLEYSTIFKSLLNKHYDRLSDIMPAIGSVQEPSQ
ncbi:transglycosylase SLT domain-containing protein [Thiomicrorhabdus cannonii]|uniref:transglycosylase SLT domain-containing protein n=1 Tax=Thiomicrorhabdus cannonii TaxID=2748011 RepID=UPI0015B818E6|nr:transglycosylase SLT domain-containing protein [Thiomicrorhabdus cannonii]